MPLRCPAAPFIIALVLLFGAAPVPAQAPSTPRAGSAMPDPDRPLPRQPGDAFGQEITLPPRTVIYLKGHAKWDNAFDTLVDAHKSLRLYFDKQGIQPNGLAMTIYTETDDTGFDFLAALPITAVPPNPPKGDIAVGQAPSGKALKFVHRGSYDAIDMTYEEITDYLDDNGLEAKDKFIEEYVTDILKTSPDNLVVKIFVPVKQP